MTTPPPKPMTTATLATQVAAIQTNINAAITSLAAPLSLATLTSVQTNLTSTHTILGQINTTPIAPIVSPVTSPNTSISHSVTIAFTNESTKATDGQVQAAMAAIQIQLDRDVFPVWGISAALVWVPKGQLLPTTYYQIVFLDNTDQAGALGYHETTATGHPLAKIFVETDLQNDLSWTVTASHETIETLIDPSASLSTLVVTSSTAYMYAYEACDAVEDDSFGYTINGILVSSFVYPAWFQPEVPTGTKLDYGNKLTVPLTLLSGGYIGYIDLNNINAGWQQFTAQKIPSRTAALQRVSADAVRPRMTKRVAKLGTNSTFNTTGKIQTAEKVAITGQLIHSPYKSGRRTAPN